FVADTTFGCTVPLEVNFTNTSSGSGILSFSWLIDGVEVSNSEDYTHTFTNLGSYDVALVVSNDSGCEATYDMADFVNINSATIDFNLPTVVCTEELVELTTFDVESYDPVVLLEWDFDEDDVPDGIGDSPNFTYDTPGEYVVSVVVTTENGCVSEVESSATILVQPNAEAVIDSGETMSCAGEPVEFCVQTVEGLNYNWNFGDNTGWNLIEFPVNCIQHDYQDTGYFDITLSVYNLACGTQLLLEDYLYISGPVALFEAEEDCGDPTLVAFQSNSIEATELTWDFGDGSPLVYNVENPTHQYATEGNYTVTLTASNPDVGCPDIATVNVNLFTDPIALNFIPNEGCPGMNVFMSSPDQTQYEVWNIDFGNGSSLESTWNAGLNRWEVYTYTPEGVDYSLFSFNANFIPFINYSSAGYFDIVIETIDWSGCQNSTTYDDAIWVYNDFYFADFDINVIEDCDSVHIEFVPTGDLLDTWEWELTDGSIVNDYTFEHVFTAPYDTTFGATFSAIDDFGCANQVSKAVDITPPPIPAFSVLSDPSCLGEEIVLQNESIGDDITFLWDFGDPASGLLNTSTEAQPSHAFNSNGAYTVCLDATNVDGCTQSLCIDDLVNIVNPVATADYVAGINNCLYGVTFDNTTTGNIQSSVWNFGDEQSGGGINVFHTYPLGVYDAELVVINEFGCSDTLVLNDILNLGDVVGPYSVTLDDITCAPFQTTFDSYNTTDNSFTYFWEFDDGNGDANNNNSTNHTYDAPGEYCPSLIMEDQNGCTVFIQCEEPFVVEEFTFETTLPEPVCFGNTMPVDASGASSYAWSDDNNIVA
ncbi:MAG: PKD domain-containing protein, partial [Flavobacteriales bacterium]